MTDRLHGMHTNIYVVNICRSAVVCFTTAVPTESKAFSGGDALRGHTRSHPEHDG